MQIRLKVSPDFDGPSFASTKEPVNIVSSLSKSCSKSTHSHEQRLSKIVSFSATVRKEKTLTFETDAKRLCLIEDSVVERAPRNF